MEKPPVIPAYPPVLKECELATISLVTGILAWLFLPIVGSLTAVICGHLAKRQIRESNGTMSGSKMATAGLVLGYIQLGIIFMAACLFITIVIITAVNLN